MRALSSYFDETFIVWLYRFAYYILNCCTLRYLCSERRSSYFAICTAKVETLVPTIIQNESGYTRDFSIVLLCGLM
jgi:hypothetical protein